MPSLIPYLWWTEWFYFAGENTDSLTQEGTGSALPRLHSNTCPPGSPETLHINTVTDCILELKEGGEGGTWCLHNHGLTLCGKGEVDQ